MVVRARVCVCLGVFVHVLASLTNWAVKKYNYPTDKINLGQIMEEKKKQLYNNYILLHNNNYISISNLFKT